MKINFLNGSPVLGDLPTKTPDFNYVTYVTFYKGRLMPPCYIGSTTEKRILSGKYFGSIVSQKWKLTFRHELEYNKHLFTAHILSYHETRKEALDEELKFQKINDVVKSENFFNESFAVPNGFYGRDVSGANNPNYGKIGRKCTDETKFKMSLSHLGKTSGKKGTKLSKETKNKLKQASTGKTASEKTKLKMRQSQKLRREHERK